MIKLSATAVSEGIVSGTLKIVNSIKESISPMATSDDMGEFARFKASVDKVLISSNAIDINNQASDNSDIGLPSSSCDVQSEILKAQALLIKDEGFVRSVEEVILDKHCSAAYAVSVVCDRLCKIFENSGDETFMSKCDDIKDITGRLIDALNESVRDEISLTLPCIIMKDSLLPSELLKLDRNNLLGLVIKDCAQTSHTAIIARTMGIPLISGIGLSDLTNREDVMGRLSEGFGEKNAIDKDQVIIDAADGRSYGQVILDADNGFLILDASETEKDEYIKSNKKEELTKEEMSALKKSLSITKGGKFIPVMANISSAGDVKNVLESGADGIGLFRTEFLYLENAGNLDEEKQFEIYRDVLKAMGDKKVIIRTFDFNGDKLPDNLKIDNSRMALIESDLFKIQLRALYRAGVYGNLSVMHPMISKVCEVEKIKEISGEVIKELSDEGVKIKPFEEGIMIETQKAVEHSVELSKMVSFFCIGSNDLTSDIFNMDRQNAQLFTMLSQDKTVIMDLMETVIKTGHEEGIWVGICGELAADTKYATDLVKAGIDELSVLPNMVSKVRKAVIEA